MLASSHQSSDTRSRATAAATASSSVASVVRCRARQAAATSSRASRYHPQTVGSYTTKPCPAASATSGAMPAARQETVSSLRRGSDAPRPPGTRASMRALPSVPVSNGCSTAGRAPAADRPGCGPARADAPRRRPAGGRRARRGPGTAGPRRRRRGGIHERRAIAVEHRPEQVLDEALVLLRPGDVALMGEQPVREAVGPVEGGELLHRGVGREGEERQGVVPAVPGEERRVAVPVGHVEGPAEGLDPMGGEERGAAVRQADGHA